jgi:pilus assembly protein Flp/PilA
VTPTLITAYRWLHWLESCDEGQGIIEYLLIMALVSVVAIIALTGLGTTIVTKLYGLSNAF